MCVPRPNSSPFCDCATGPQLGSSISGSYACLLACRFVIVIVVVVAIVFAAAVTIAVNFLFLQSSCTSGLF